MDTPNRFNIGDSVPGGKQIKRIIGQSDSVIVYVTDTETIAYHLGYSESELSPERAAIIRTALQCFEKTYPEAKRVHSESEWRMIRDEVAAAFYSSLTSNSTNGCHSAFRQINNKVAARASDRGRFVYLSAAAITAAIAAGVFAVGASVATESPFQGYLLCALCATGGAAASVMTRIGSVEVNPSEHIRIVRIRGASRVVLALLITAFAVIAAKANLIAGLVSDNQALLLAYSFVCGFSERFGPELLAGIEDTLPKPRRADDPE